MDFKQLAGVACILWALIVAYRRLSAGKKTSKMFLTFMTCVWVSGIALIISGRITHVKAWKGIIDIEAASEEAAADAKAIKQIRDRVDNQRDTIDAAFAQAGNALKTSQQASNKVAEINTIIERANQTIDLTSLIIRAQGMDKAAFFRLFESPTNSIAQEAVMGIVAKVELDAALIKAANLTHYWAAKGIKDPSKLTFEESKKMYEKEFRPHLRFGLVQHVILSPNYTERKGVGPIHYTFHRRQTAATHLESNQENGWKIARFRPCGSALFAPSR